MSFLQQEIVFEGWLIKSPPTKGLWKARWRRRWFVLKHSGELPMQYFLMYYTGKDCRKLKGTIDLDQCDQVDSGLRVTHGKHNYPFMFNIKTRKRTYYLAADTDMEMNKWVDCLCQVCALKTATDDYEDEDHELQTNMDPSSAISLTKHLDPVPEAVYYYNDPLSLGHMFPESPPVSPTSSVSGPYIPISDCVSGKPLNTPKGISDFNNILMNQLSFKMSKDFVRTPFGCTPYISHICNDDISKSKVSKSIALPMPAPPVRPHVEKINSLYEDRNNLNPGREDKITNIESAKKMAEQRGKQTVNDEFYDCPRKAVVMPDDEWVSAAPPCTVPTPNWETFPAHEETDFSPGDIGSWSVVEKGGKFKIVDSKAPFVTNSLNRVPRQRSQPDTYSLGRPIAPPRPPKPQHLAIPEQPQAEVSSSADNDSEPTPSPSECTETEETYDIPRSHQRGESDGQTRDNYINANPHFQGQGTVFVYPDCSESDPVHPSCCGETISPRFEGSAAQYTNLPSPIVTPVPGAPTPPAVNRDLKPSRKMSDSGASSEPSPGPFTPTLGTVSISSAEPSPVGNGPPSIDRTLKPRKPLQEGVMKLARPPVSRVRAGPSAIVNPSCQVATTSALPKTTGVARSPIQDQMYMFNDYQENPIQYLDLDLNSSAPPAPVLAPIPAALSPGILSLTTYRTIDFVKTEAFNRTREEIEEKRKEWGGSD